MGSSASKASRAAGASARKYPTGTPATSNAANAPNAPNLSSSSAATSSPGPSVRPPPRVFGSRDEAVNLDASDPDFARSLRSLGPVQPNPTLSPTSAFPHAFNANPAQRATGPDPRSNPAIAVLNSRARLLREAEQEFLDAGRRDHQGRQFLDVHTIRQILIQRDERGKSASEIEKTLGLKQGVVARLGTNGMLGLAQDTGRAQKYVEMV